MIVGLCESHLGLPKGQFQGVLMSKMQAAVMQGPSLERPPAHIRPAAGLCPESAVELQGAVTCPLVLGNASVLRHFLKTSLKALLRSQN